MHLDRSLFHPPAQMHGLLPDRRTHGPLVSDRPDSITGAGLDLFDTQHEFYDFVLLHPPFVLPPDARIPYGSAHPDRLPSPARLNQLSVGLDLLYGTARCLLQGFSEDFFESSRREVARSRQAQLWHTEESSSRQIHLLMTARSKTFHPGGTNCIRGSANERLCAVERTEMTILKRENPSVGRIVR